MKAKRLAEICVLLFFTSTVYAQTYTSTTTGNGWVSTHRWVYGRERRETIPTIMAKNTFTINALNWSKKHGGWTHKICNVNGSNRYWNMTEITYNLMDAWEPTMKGNRKSYHSSEKIRDYDTYIPSFKINESGQTNPPSYYMMGGVGYKRKQQKHNNSCLKGE